MIATTDLTEFRPVIAELAGIFAAELRGIVAEPHDPRMWTLKECAGYLNVSEETTAWQAEHEGLPCRRIGKGGKGEYRFVPELVREWARTSPSSPAFKIHHEPHRRAPRPAKVVRR
jgi:hypothetical protein